MDFVKNIPVSRCVISPTDVFNQVELPHTWSPDEKEIKYSNLRDLNYDLEINIYFDNAFRTRNTAPKKFNAEKIFKKMLHPFLLKVSPCLCDEKVESLKLSCRCHLEIVCWQNAYNWYLTHLLPCNSVLLLISKDI